MRQTKLTYAAVGVAMAISALIVGISLLRVHLPAEDGIASAAGADLFLGQGCGQCHYTDRTETKIGPGLKDLLKREQFPASGWSATRKNVRKQLLEPYDSMPSYADRLSEEQIQLLTDYLETL
jgi:mono/diheme cytochrome c family protein